MPDEDSILEQAGQSPAMTALSAVPNLPGKVSPADALNPMPSVASGTMGAPKSGEVIPPSSPDVAKAIARMKAWLPINERNGPNPLIRMNIQILERGGKIAEAMAKGILKDWKEHPNERPAQLEPPTIEGEP